MKTKELLSILCIAASALQVRAQSEPVEPAPEWEVATLFSFNDANRPDVLPEFAANSMRGLAVYGGELYIPARNTPANGNAVMRFNAATGEFVGTLDMTGISGGTFAINDIAISDDGVIYVSNMTSDARSTTANAVPFKIYKYATPESTPEVALSFFADQQTTTQGTAKSNAFRLGDGLTISGTSQNGVFISSIDKLLERCYAWTIADGVVDPNPTCLAFHNSVAEKETTPLSPAFAKYGRFYMGFDENTVIERSKDEENRLRVFEYVRENTNGWRLHQPVSTGSLNPERLGSSNGLCPFEFRGKRYIATVDFKAKGASTGQEGQAVIYDVTDYAAPEEVFRTETIGKGNYQNGTVGIDVQVNENSFCAYFLCADGLCGYEFTAPKISTGLNAPATRLDVVTDRDAQTVTLPAEVASVRVYQAQTGTEVGTAAGAGTLYFDAPGVYILNATLTDGQTVNCKVIL